MKQLIALIDCSSFYCSCERVFRPDLTYKPICVLSNNDGCVVARDQFVKDIGVPMGAPYFKFKEVLLKNRVTVFSSNYDLYADMSRRVMLVLKQFSPDFEQYSIDEGYMGISVEELSVVAERERIMKWGQEIKDTVYKHTGIPVRVSVAENKTLAKLGSYYAKQLIKEGKEPIVCLWNHPDKQQILANTAVGEVWGIGRQKSKKLIAAGVKSIKQLMDLPDGYIRGRYTVSTLLTVYELRGMRCIDLEETAKQRKTLVRSRTLGEKTDDLRTLLTSIDLRTYRGVQKLRREKLVAKKITVFMQTSRFADKQIFSSDTFELHVPSNDFLTFSAVALRLANKIYKKGYQYAKTGIIFSDMCTQNQIQLSLMDIVEDETRSKIIDACNLKFGDRVVSMGAATLSKAKSSHEMQRNLLSPGYTTNIKRVMRVA